MYCKKGHADFWFVWNTWEALQSVSGQEASWRDLLGLWFCHRLYLSWHQQTVSHSLTWRTHIRKQSSEIQADCSRRERRQPMCGCVTSPPAAHTHALTLRRMLGETRRRSDRLFVKARFICENGRDASHYQRVCLSKTAISSSCFRKKANNWQSITILIMSSLHPSISCITSIHSQKFNFKKKKVIYFTLSFDLLLEVGLTQQLSFHISFHCRFQKNKSSSKEDIEKNVCYFRCINNFYMTSNV